MKNKYNIALIPKTSSNAVVEYSKKFSPIAYDYLLGEKSLPHVTLYQFYTDKNEINVILEKLKTSNIHKSIELKFSDFSRVSFDNGKTYWISLIPEEISELNKMHKMIAELIQQPVKTNFDPHMTLVHTREKDFEPWVQQVKRAFNPIHDKFALSLGQSDEVGQYLKTIYQC